MLKHATPFFAIAAAAAMILTSPIPAQAQEIGPTPPEDIARTRANFPNPHDAGVDALVTALIGMHRGDDHTLYINRVELPDSAPALYVELVLAGEENHPVRQQLWVPHRRDNQLQVRVCELPLAMRDLVVGMWAAPGLFPSARLEQYSSLGDLSVEGGDGHYTIEADHTLPIAREGAIEYDLRFERTPAGVRWTDAGRAINGDEIFALNLNMKTRPTMPEARELDGGILVYDLREGFVGASPVNKDSIVFYYSEWTMDGFLIDTTNQPRRGGHVFTIPDEHKALRSWNLGVIGLRQGGIRRIYDPKSHSGMLNGQLKPFRGQPMALITELECISVKDNTP